MTAIITFSLLGLIALFASLLMWEVSKQGRPKQRRHTRQHQPVNSQRQRTTTQPQQLWTRHEPGQQSKATDSQVVGWGIYGVISLVIYLARIGYFASASLSAYLGIIIVMFVVTWLLTRESEQEKQKRLNSKPPHGLTDNPVNREQFKKQPFDLSSVPSINQQQTSSNRRTLHDLHPLRIQLLSMVNGHVKTADNLLQQCQKKYPGMTTEWYFDKVIQDLIRDRR